ncbi:uncharacterized protein Z519_10377 [Cladophialophora bantiana CBS 173.52]|uniref:Uncharacterized protein n=1 Tax=Cladophialophora bantiana (strain ATCC 10958 / CBS 173.52 / CDC B-1940 / NIH 8579) TaxID=1442370 RepID=A0A0D2H6E7_CLAB1|nr:uncharacterized protein Z519_10377 [Cladophialophora bantiana CBS 173.52]KIW88893.1 hypothetical protein Z519_10377 [Cladophialophora bantiana CBS 173.52]
MAPRGRSTATPTRRMTRPSAMRRTPAAPTESTSSSATQGATAPTTPSRAPRNTTKSPSKTAIPAAQPRRAPAKPASTRAKPKATPATKTPKTTSRTKATPIARTKDDKGNEDGAPQTTIDNNQISENEEAETRTRKSKPLDIGVSDNASEDESVIPPRAEAASTPKGKRKVVAVEGEPYVDEEETDEQDAKPVESKTPVRKRKTRPFDEQAYRYEGEDSDDDDDEELDDDVPGDLPVNRIRRIHLKVDLERHKQYMQMHVERRARASPAASSSSSGSGSSQPPSTSTSSTCSSRSARRQRTGPPLKRQRTVLPTVADPLDPSSSGAQMDAVDPNDPLFAAEQLFENIEKIPRALDLDEIGALFMILQEKISRFCNTHFDFDLTTEQEKAWPMHLLATKYLSLMLITQRIADGSEYGWQNFFTKREYRRHLVHGIIGEWFQQRIFKHTGFSLPEEKVRELEKIDRKFLHYDAFVRNKKKAECLEELKFAEDYFPSEEFPKIFEHMDNLEIAARRMATNLLRVLEPLLPPPSFDPTRPQWRQPSRLREQGDEVRLQIWFQLIELIRMAGSLHLCIRFAGANGLVVRIAPHVPKGTRLRRDDVENNICVNANALNVESAQSRKPNDELEVKMTCFGRVEAVVPNGLDVLELEQAQTSARAEGRELTREEAEQNLFNLYPYDLQETDAAKDAVADLPPIPGTEWSTALLKAGIEEARAKRYGRDLAEDERIEQGSPKSGAFVTIYPRVAPSNLYCEWVSSSEDQQFPRIGDAAPQPSAQTLAEAVAEARRKKYISCPLEDAALMVWNTVWARGFLEWLVLAGGIAGVSALTAPWVRNAVQSVNWPERSMDVGMNVQACAVHALSAVGGWQSALQDASAYVSQLVAPTAASTSVTVTALPTDWTTTTTTMLVDDPTDGDQPMEDVSPPSTVTTTTVAASSDPFSEYLEGLTSISRRTIARDDPEFAMVASLFSEQMGFVQAETETQTPPQLEPTPSPTARHSKVL